MIGTVENETFKWYFRSKATKWTILSGSQSGTESVDIITEEWDVVEQTKTKFEISSSACPICLVVGKSTLTFTR